MEAVRSADGAGLLCTSLRAGAGRLWLLNGPRTLEGYGPRMEPLSRHRLKGDVLRGNLAVDASGALTARTWNNRDAVLRTYRIS